MKRLNLPEKDLTLRNQIYSSIYDVLWHIRLPDARQKRGRNFLLHLQKSLADGKTAYSKELLTVVAYQS